MAKGIIYCMTTGISGIVKIGKTNNQKSFEERMRFLESNGYNQVNGHKRKFAIEVDGYDEKELMLHELLSKSRIKNSELFAIDETLVVRLMASMKGKVIYPKDYTQEEIFEEASEEANKGLIPDGIYTVNKKSNSIGNVTAMMKVDKGKIIVLKGSTCLPCNAKTRIPEARKQAKIKKGILMEDVECGSPSIAGWVILGYSVNGWTLWKDKNGNPIDIYRKLDENED